MLAATGLGFPGAKDPPWDPGIPGECLHIEGVMCSAQFLALTVWDVLCHNALMGARIGEALNPGPGASAATKRRRAERNTNSMLEGLNLQALLGPLVQKLVDQIIKQLMSGSGLQQMLSGNGLIPSEKTAKPKSSEKPAKPQKPKKPKKPTIPLLGGTKSGVPAEIAKPDAPVKPKADQGWQTVKRKKPERSEAAWTLRQQDWDDPVMSFHSLGDRMDKCTGTFSAVLLCNEQEENIFKTMLQGYSKPYRVLMVRMSSESGAERVPGKIEDKLVFKQALVQRCYSKGLAAPQPKSMAQSAVKVAKKPTVVIAVRMFKRFMDEADWKLVQQAPTRFFHSWLLAHEVQALDSWGWKAERSNAKSDTDKYFGLARILQEDVESVLALSGDRVFVDTHRQYNLKCSVTWFLKQDKEDDMEYLTRLRRGGWSLGLVAGRSQLGAREKSNGTPARIWLIEHVPADWSQEEVLKVLNTVFTEVALIRQRYHKKGGHTIQHTRTCGETVGDKGRQGETRGDKGRQGETRGDKGRQDLREGGHTIQYRHTCGETVGDKGRQGEIRLAGRRTHHPIEAHMWGDSGRQGESRGDKGRQDLREGGHTIQYRHTCGETVGDKGRQGETRGDKGRQDLREGGHTIQYSDTCGETVGDKGRQGETRPAGKRTHHPIEAHMWGDSGRQGESRGDKGRQDLREGGHTIQSRHTCGETVGDKGSQGETRGDKTCGKADTPSNTGTHVGRQWETRGDKGRQGETRGDKTCGKADTPSNTVTHVGRQWETRGDKGRQDLREGGHTIQ